MLLYRHSRATKTRVYNEEATLVTLYTCNRTPEQDNSDRANTYLLSYEEC